MQYICATMKVGESKFCGCMYFVSNALARKVSKIAEDSWKPVNLSPSHAYLLMLTIEKPGIQPSELVDNLHLMPSTITRLIEKLEEKKLVIRSNEGKVTNVYATPKGQALLPKLQACSSDFQQRYTEAIGLQESKELVSKMINIADKI